MTTSTEKKAAVNVIITSTKSTKLSKELQSLETTIRNANKAFILEGEALCQIINKEYYVQRGFSTFETYVNTMFDMTRNFAYKRMAAFRIMHILTSAGFTPKQLPQSESQCRPMTTLNGEDSESYQAQIVPTWERVVAHNCRITAALIQKEVNVTIGKPEPEEDTKPENATDTSTDTTGNTETKPDAEEDTAKSIDAYETEIAVLKIKVLNLESKLEIERNSKPGTLPNSKIARDMIQAGFKAIVPTLDKAGKKEALSVKAAMLGL